MLSRMKKTPVGEVKLPLKNEMIRPFFFRKKHVLVMETHALLFFVGTMDRRCKDRTARMRAVGPTCEKRPCGPYGPYAVPTARMRAVWPAVPAARNL